MTNTVEPITDEERQRFMATPWLEIAAQDQSSMWRRTKAYEARLSAVEEENKRLREALEPFAEATLHSQATSIGFKDGSYFQAAEGYKNVHCAMKGDATDHFNRARNALSKGKDDGS